MLLVAMGGPCADTARAVGHCAVACSQLPARSPWELPVPRAVCYRSGEDGVCCFAPVVPA